MGAVVVAMAAAAVLALVGLDNHLFWDDEANTAIYARNLIQRGELTAWDGTNLVGYAQSRGLGEDLGQELRVPALPACVAALGMSLCGENTFGGRIMFVIAGVLSIGLLAVWVRRHLGRRFPWWLPSIILAVSPAYLLYIRNCRYYAAGVMFTLLVWIFWAPGSSRGRLSNASLFDRRSLLRYAGGSIAIALLLFTHYLNAAAVLVTLPLFFFDRRYRQPRQYVLLGVITVTLACGVAWILATANPFAADYRAAEDWLFGTVPERGYLTRFFWHLWLLLRDLGTHEFFPWCLLPVFLVPWLPVSWLPVSRLPVSWLPVSSLLVRARRLRGLARRAWLLVGVTLAYVVLAALITPPDMGKGDWAEMRYVVPLLAVGSVVGGLALVILWRIFRPLAPLVLLLLVLTNVLHLGFLTERYDRTSTWWPPTLYRYVQESFNDYRTGNEAMIALLDKLPQGTTVRAWPTYMVYPPMFYVRKLHYCDQLSERKKIQADLDRALRKRDYLYIERARPDVVLVPATYVGRAFERLNEQFPDDSYELRNTLPADWNYTSKPEIPAHVFCPPSGDRQWYRGMAVLVRKGSPAADHPALAIERDDPHALYRLSLTLGDLAAALEAAGHVDQALDRYLAAVKIFPGRPTVHYNLANLLADRGMIDEAIYHYRQVLKSDPNYAKAHVNLGGIMLNRSRIEEAINHCRKALQIETAAVKTHVRAHANLALALYARANKQAAIGDVQGAIQNKSAAIAELHKALKLEPPHSILALKIRDILRQWNARQ